MIYETCECGLPSLIGLTKVKAIVEKYSPVAKDDVEVEVEGIIVINGWAQESDAETGKTKSIYSIALAVCECDANLIGYSGSVIEGKHITAFSPRIYSNFRVIKVL